MPSLKDLKNRIGSVKSTRKITSAMKMVAASKLRRAQEQAENARPYASRMAHMLNELLTFVPDSEKTSKLITGTGADDSYLLIVMTSDRGLCGSFNSSVVRDTRKKIRELEGDGKKVQLVCVGRKARDLLRREHGDKIIQVIENVGRRGSVDYAVSDALTAKLLEMYENGEIDVAMMIYNSFKSAISQVVTSKRLLPAEVTEPTAKALDKDAPVDMSVQHALCEVFEPSKEALLHDLLPRNLGVQVYGAMLESAAGEQGARMTAMDNATRNAGEMIDRLTLNYNRSRQAQITKELIEIISGAEAV